MENSAANSAVAIARALVGTPFEHQGRQPGVGIDCIGVVMHVAHTLGITDYDRTNYGRSPHTDELERALDMLFVRKTGGPAVGEIALFKFRNERVPQHVAIVTDTGIIHAHASFGRCVEHRFNYRWRRRLVRGYQWQP